MDSKTATTPHRYILRIRGTNKIQCEIGFVVAKLLAIGRKEYVLTPSHSFLQQYVAPIACSRATGGIMNIGTGWLLPNLKEGIGWCSGHENQQ